MTNALSDEDSSQQFDHDDRQAQLSRAADLRSTEDQVLWSIFGAFWGANTVLLVALFATGKLPESPFVGLVVSAAGTLLSVVWHVIQRRAIGHLKRFDVLMERLERDLDVPPHYAVSAKINVEDHDACLGSGGLALSRS